MIEDEAVVICEDILEAPLEVVERWKMCFVWCGYYDEEVDGLGTFSGGMVLAVPLYCLFC